MAAPANTIAAAERVKFEAAVKAIFAALPTDDEPLALGSLACAYAITGHVTGVSIEELVAALRDVYAQHANLPPLPSVAPK